MSFFETVRIFKRTVYLDIVKQNDWGKRMVYSLKEYLSPWSITWNQFGLLKLYCHSHMFYINLRTFLLSNAYLLLAKRKQKKRKQNKTKNKQTNKQINRQTNKQKGTKCWLSMNPNDIENKVRSSVKMYDIGLIYWSCCQIY